MNPARAGTLSLGPGQIQLRHWREAESWASLMPSVAKIRKLLSWEATFDVAERLLAGTSTTQQRAAVYRGEARSYHVSCLRYVESWLRTLEL